MTALPATIFLLASVALTSACDPFSACHRGKPGFLNVHIVPHSHDDPGFLKTVDQYYLGSANDVDPMGGVQYIFDTVIDELQRSPQRRYVQSEVSFFHRWWRTQNDDVRSIVRHLIEENRLQIVGGGWAMPDEAVTHYSGVIDTVSIGLRLLRHELGGNCSRARVGWQIDPFGQSRSVGELFAGIAYDALVIVRLDYQEKSMMRRERKANFLWRTGGESELYTTILPTQLYGSPKGFCFDLVAPRCRDDPIQDDPQLVGYNVPEKVDAFVEAVKRMAAWSASEEIIVPMGGDMQFVDARYAYFFSSHASSI